MQHDNLEKILDRFQGVSGMLDVIWMSSEDGGGQSLTDAIGAVKEYFNDTVMQLKEAIKE